MCDRQLVGRAKMAMAAFAECGVDLLLAGHLHLSRSADTGERYALSGYEALVVSAGTATSTRGRGEANSFNVLGLSKDDRGRAARMAARTGTVRLREAVKCLSAAGADGRPPPHKTYTSTPKQPIYKRPIR